MASKTLSELSSKAERLLDTTTAHRDPDYLSPVFTHLLSVVILSAAVRLHLSWIVDHHPVESNPANKSWISESPENNYENNFDRDLILYMV